MMDISFCVVESVSNPGLVGTECLITVPVGSFVPRVGEVCYLPDGPDVAFVVSRVSTRWVLPPAGSYVPCVRVDLRS